MRYDIYVFRQLRVKKTVRIALHVEVLLFDESERRDRSRELGAQWVGALAAGGVNATINRGHSRLRST